jgi:hypothetical protein
MTTTTDQTVSGVKTFLNGKLGFRNVANTFTSFFTNSATGSRTYTFQNRNGTIADTTDLAGKMANPNGTENFLSKFLTATTIGISRIIDTGTYLGIGTVNAPNKDLTFGNQSNKEIAVEPSDSTIKGRDLIVSAGKTVNYSLSSNFNPLGVAILQIRDICNGIGNDMFVAVYGGIYKQTNGTGAFALVSQNLSAHGVGIDKTTGTVYAVTTAGDIYKQTNGTGAFVALGEVLRGYRTCRVHQNGNIYVTSDTGLFMQTGGTGAFNLISAVSAFYGLAINPINGDVYVNNGNATLSVQTAGAGAFNFYSNNDVESRNMAFTPTGDMIVFKSNKLWKRIYGTTPFVAITEISGALFSIGVSENSNVYTSDYYVAEIYMQNNVALGTVNLDGGTLIHKSGTGKGAGKSRWQAWTGQKTVSGTDMQIETLRIQANEVGEVILPTTTIAIIDAETTGKQIATKEWVVSKAGSGSANSVNLRYETTWVSGTQQFTTPTDYLSVSNVIVQGVSLSNSQYSLQGTNKVTILDTLNVNDYIVIIYGSTVAITADPAQITITTAVSITTDTLGNLGKSQKGKHVLIDNGVNPINITVNGGVEFVATYEKLGTGAITFVQGANRALNGVDGGLVMNGAIGSTAAISSGIPSATTKDNIRISNAT